MKKEKKVKKEVNGKEIKVKSLPELGSALKAKEVAEVKTALEGSDIEAIRAKMLGDIPRTEGLTEAHTANQLEREANQLKMVKMGKIVEELFSRKSEFEETLHKMRGASLVKDKVENDIKEIDKNIKTLYDQMPGLEEHVSYRAKVDWGNKIKNFKNLGFLLQRLLKEGRAHTAELNFYDARERFPGKKIIMYRGLAHVINGVDLGNALIEARKRCLKEANDRQAAEEAAKTTTMLLAGPKEVTTTKE